MDKFAKGKQKLIIKTIFSVQFPHKIMIIHEFLFISNNVDLHTKHYLFSDIILISFQN